MWYKLLDRVTMNVSLCRCKLFNAILNKHYFYSGTKALYTISSYKWDNKTLKRSVGCRIQTNIAPVSAQSTHIHNYTHACIHKYINLLSNTGRVIICDMSNSGDGGRLPELAEYPRPARALTVPVRRVADTRAALSRASLSIIATHAHLGILSQNTLSVVKPKLA